MKTYTVIGTRPYLGHQPGETFEAEIPEWEERRALGRRSITVVGAAGEGTDPASTQIDAPDPRVKELLAMKRPDLDERALGLELDPEEFGNKTELAEAIVNAIDDAGNNKTPERSGDDE